MIHKCNCFSRLHRPSAWIPSYFKARLFRGSDSLSKIAKRTLLRKFNKLKSLNASNLKDRIPGSQAKIWKITQYSGMNIVITECKKLLPKAMIDSSRLQRHVDRQIDIRDC